MSVLTGKLWMIGTSRPIDADGTALRGRDRRPAWASDARARYAKKSKSCANPPRFERRCEAYKCIMGVLQYPDHRQRAKSVFKRSGYRFASRKRVKSRI